MKIKKTIFLRTGLIIFVLTINGCNGYKSVSNGYTSVNKSKLRNESDHEQSIKEDLSDFLKNGLSKFLPYLSKGELTMLKKIFNEQSYCVCFLPQLTLDQLKLLATLGDLGLKNDDKQDLLRSMIGNTGINKDQLLLMIFLLKDAPPSSTILFDSNEVSKFGLIAKTLSKVNLTDDQIKVLYKMDISELKKLVITKDFEKLTPEQILCFNYKKMIKNVIYRVENEGVVARLVNEIVDKKNTKLTPKIISLIIATCVDEVGLDNVLEKLKTSEEECIKYITTTPEEFTKQINERIKDYEEMIDRVDRNLADAKKGIEAAEKLISEIDNK